jgi:hypothetical protein
MIEVNDNPADEPFKFLREEGECIKWETSSGEQRLVAVFEGEVGDVMVEFHRGSEVTRLLLSDQAATALASLLLKRKTVC